MGTLLHFYGFAIAALLVLLLNNLSIAEEACYEDDPHEPNYGSETIYSQAKKLIRSTLPEESDRVPGCEPLQLQLFLRHGTRYPSARDRKRMLKFLKPLQANITHNYNYGRTKICGEDMTQLRKWNFTYNTSTANFLAPRGDREVRRIANTYDTFFPYLLRPPSLNSDLKEFEFWHTGTPMARMSARSFAMELFGRDFSRNAELRDPDSPVIKPQDGCADFAEEVLDVSSHKEVDEFGTSDKIHKMTAAVSGRLGFKAPLSLDRILLMHMACRFEYGTNDGYSPWCVAFTREDIEVLEFYNDLEHWWLNGYGLHQNNDQTCTVMQNIVKNLQRVAGNAPNSYPRAIFSFTNSNFMLRLLTTLGLHQDGGASFKMTSADFGRPRKWRLSQIDSFAANLGLVIYKCKKGKHKIKVFAQEQPIKLPVCAKIVCEYDEFVNSFEIQSCNVPSTLCAPKISPSSTFSGSIHLNGPNVPIMLILFATQVAQNAIATFL